MISPADTSVTIVDGYVDEPAHFGVPPYLSTYPRYTAGALVDAGVPESAITYHTIDELRADRQTRADVADADLFVYVGGMTVPGKYVARRGTRPRVDRGRHDPPRRSRPVRRRRGERRRTRDGA